MNDEIRDYLAKSSTPEKDAANAEFLGSPEDTATQAELTSFFTGGYAPERRRELSRMLFNARESIEMLADIVESRTGVKDVHNRALVDEIDAYRALHGWSRDGYGRES